MKTDIITLTHGEQGYAMNQQARKSIESATFEKLKRLVALTQITKNAAIEGVQLVWEIGLNIGEWTQHQDLTAAEHQKLAAGFAELPATVAGVSFAKRCVAVHRDNAEPPKTYALCAPIWESVIKQIELIPRTHREQMAHGGDLFTLFLDGVQSIARDYKKALLVKPLEQWDRDSLESFVKDVEPMHEGYLRAKELLNGSVEV